MVRTWKIEIIIAFAWLLFPPHVSAVTWVGETQKDTAAPGYYRSPADFPIPQTWTDIQKRRFLSLTSGLNDSDKRTMRTWARPSLKTNTQWIDAKADAKKGYIEVTIPIFSAFTFVGISPNRGTVEQDFKGNAKIYNLDDEARYTIWAFDAMDFIGKKITGISNKYIRGLQEHVDSWSGVRVPIMAQKVVEDPNKNLWVSVYEPEWTGSAYQLMDIYSLKPEKDIRSKFQVPLTTSYIRPWLSDIILESNGDITFSACEDPMGLSAFLGPSYVARIEKSGTTVWETASNQLSSAICIAPLEDGGYVYGGATFSTDPLYLDKQLGRIARLTPTGGHTPWASSGTTYVDVDYSVRDIKSSFQSGCSSSASETEYSPTDCNAQYNEAALTAFDCDLTTDDSDATEVLISGSESVVLSVIHDLGFSRAATEIIVRFKGDSAGRPYAGHFVNVYGSNDSWGWLGAGDDFYPMTWRADPAGTWIELVLDGTGKPAYRYYTFTINGLPSGDSPPEATPQVECSKFVIKGTSPGDCVSGVSTYHYVGGRNNTGGPRLFSAASGGCPSSAYSYEDSPAQDSKCCSGMDGDMTGFSFSGEGGCGYALVGCGWNNGSQTATKSKVWYHTAEASTITLQYDSGGWQTISSVAATADGDVHLWEVDFAAVTASNWRITFSTVIGGTPCAPSLEEWQLYPASTGGGVVAKYALEGSTSGSQLWNTKYLHPESLAGIFNAVVISPRDASRIYGFGSTEHSTVNLSLNKGMALCVNTSGTSIWAKDYAQVSEFYDASPTEDGGFLLAGTIYTGTSVQARSAVIMKIDRDGNVDPKFPQTFAEDGHWADGRGVIESRDGGIIEVGGSSSSTQSTSKPLFIKLDRFYRAKTKGNLYN